MLKSRTIEHFPCLCNISSASISVLHRPGHISRVGLNSDRASRPFMKSRLRYVSFFAIGIDSRYLGIITVLGPSSICHVLKIMPSATRVSNILQEHIIVSFLFKTFLWLLSNLHAVGILHFKKCNLMQPNVIQKWIFKNLWELFWRNLQL